jgi:hypothetical protein
VHVVVVCGGVLGARLCDLFQVCLFFALLCCSTFLSCINSTEHITAIESKRSEGSVQLPRQPHTWNETAKEIPKQPQETMVISHATPISSLQQPISSLQQPISSRNAHLFTAAGRKKISDEFPLADLKRRMETHSSPDSLTCVSETTAGTPP